MKTVLITGASGGIGSACAEQFLKLGYNVVAGYFNNKDGVDALEKYAKSSRLLKIKANISSKDDVDMIFKIAIDEFGCIDTVVNNAAISLNGLIQDMTHDDFEKIVDINIKGSFYVCQNAARHMISNHKGSIINISSMWGEVGASCESAYSMTKSALIGLTKSMAKELGPSGIRVNCVSPGLIDTPMNSHMDTESLEWICEETPLMRIGKPSEVADVVLYLAGDKSTFITGQIIGVNGGFVI